MVQQWCNFLLNYVTNNRRFYRDSNPKTNNLN